MRAIAYWTCFVMAAAPVLYGWIAWLLMLLGVELMQFSMLFLSIMTFGSLVPPMFRTLVPFVVMQVFQSIVLLLVGSGVPAAMLMIPAIFCIPWAFFITELLSFRVRK